MFCCSVSQFEMAQEQEQLPGPFLDQQDSLEESWNGLVDYLNMTENSIGERSSNDTLLQLSDEQSTPLAMMSDLEQDADLQADYLIHNATLPSVNMDLSNEFSELCCSSSFFFFLNEDILKFLQRNLCIELFNIHFTKCKSSFFFF